MAQEACTAGGRLVWVGAMLVACSNNTGAPAPGPAPTTPAPGPTISFVDPGPLDLAPGAQARLAAQLSPPRSALVRFALLDDPADASFDVGAVVADDRGVASATLRAPSRASSFRVRASIESGAAGERLITVSKGGAGSVRVTALYTGKRSTPLWGASLVPADQGCDAPDGDLGAQGALPLLIEGVPSGQRFKVRLRSGGAASGCAEIEPLDANELRSIEVIAKNTTPLPPATPFTLTMAFTPEPSAWGKAVGAWSNRLRGAYLGGHDDDPLGARALLDTMMVLAAPAVRPSLLAARDDLAWDALASQHFSVYKGPALALSWLADARDSLQRSPGEVRGTLLMQAASASFKPQHLLSLGEADALTSKAASFQIGPDDALLVSGELSFWPTRLLGRQVEQIAGASGPALIQLLRGATGCKPLAATLAKTQAAPSCAFACLQNLCESAVEVMWSRAVGADEAAGATASLSYTASGAAILDDQVRLVGFSGSWVGSIKDIQLAGATTPLSGAAEATPAP